MNTQDKSIGEHIGSPAIIVQLRPVLDLTDDQLYEFSQINRDLRIERNAQGELIIMPLCPTFVIGLRSASDSLPGLEEKMREYLENGASLGWLIDAGQRRVYVYKSSGERQELESPDFVSADPILPGFELDMREIW